MSMHPDALDGPADPRIEQAREMGETPVNWTEDRILLLRIHAAAVEALTEIASGTLPDQPAASGLDEQEWAMQHIARLRRMARGGLAAASNIRFNETPTPKLTECTFCRSWHSKPCGEGCHWSL